MPEMILGKKILPSGFNVASSTNPRSLAVKTALSCIQSSRWWDYRRLARRTWHDYQFAPSRKIVGCNRRPHYGGYRLGRDILKLFTMRRFAFEQARVFFSFCPLQRFLGKFSHFIRQRPIGLKRDHESYAKCPRQFLQGIYIPRGIVYVFDTRDRRLGSTNLACEIGLLHPALLAYHFDLGCDV